MRNCEGAKDWPHFDMKYINIVTVNLFYCYSIYCYCQFTFSLKWYLIQSLKDIQ